MQFQCNLSLIFCSLGRLFIWSDLGLFKLFKRSPQKWRISIVSASIPSFCICCLKFKVKFKCHSKWVRITYRIYKLLLVICLICFTQKYHFRFTFSYSRFGETFPPPDGHDIAKCDLCMNTIYIIPKTKDFDNLTRAFECKKGVTTQKFTFLIIPEKLEKTVDKFQNTVVHFILENGQNFSTSASGTICKFIFERKVCIYG